MIFTTTAHHTQTSLHYMMGCISQLISFSSSQAAAKFLTIKAFKFVVLILYFSSNINVQKLKS